MLHYYRYTRDGFIEHSIQRDGRAEDVVPDFSTLTPLLGWPTPAMVQTLDDVDELSVWWVGTDASGRVIDDDA